jgi:hypothetical protein
MVENLIRKGTENILLVFSVLLFITGKILLRDTCFFWDSVSTLSEPSLFLYDNRFSFVFPADMVDDNLFLCTVMAGLWKTAGCSLAVSHGLFAGTGIMLIYQLYRLCKLLVPDKTILPYVFLLVLSDPSLVTQSLLLMTDAVMLLFTVMSVRYLLENRRIALAVCAGLLSLLRVRGFCLCAGIGLGYYLHLLCRDKGKNPFHLAGYAFLPFLPAVLSFAGFYVFRYITAGGYYFTREGGAWSSHYHFAGFGQLLKNMAVAGRCFLDYGRVFIWVAFIALFFKAGGKRLFRFPIHIPCIFFVSVSLCLWCVTLPLTNPIGFRYFIFPYMMFALIVGILLFSLLERKQAKIICILLIAGLWSGHLWIYPEKISNGWDATLAHLPYYGLRNEMLQYLDENNMDYKETASFFPAFKSRRKIDLLPGDNRTFAPLDFQANRYILYSNIANWSDEDIEEINRWVMEKEFRRGGVFIRIYRRKPLSP